MIHTTEEPLPLAFGMELQDALDRGMQHAQGDAHLGVSAAVLVLGFQVWTGSSGNS